MDLFDNLNLDESSSTYKKAVFVKERFLKHVGVLSKVALVERKSLGLDFSNSFYNSLNLYSDSDASGYIRMCLDDDVIFLNLNNLVHNMFSLDQKNYFSKLNDFESLKKDEAVLVFDKYLDAVMDLELDDAGLNTIRHELDHISVYKSNFFRFSDYRLFNDLSSKQELSFDNAIKLHKLSFDYYVDQLERLPLLEARGLTFNYVSLNNWEHVDYDKLASNVQDIILNKYKHSLIDNLNFLSMGNADAKQVMSDFFDKRTIEGVGATIKAFKEDKTRLNRAVHVTSFDDYIKICNG
ncbi:MAG: hypothetical protein ACMXX9_02425 [Candidatus Woesearchaeota archaeon]